MVPSLGCGQSFLDFLCGLGVCLRLDGGAIAEAKAAVIELRKLMPNYTVDRWIHAGFSDNPAFLSQYQRIVEGLRKAGLPEQ